MSATTNLSHQALILDDQPIGHVLGQIVPHGAVGLPKGIGPNRGVVDGEPLCRARSGDSGDAKDQKEVGLVEGKLRADFAQNKVERDHEEQRAHWRNHQREDHARPLVGRRVADGNAQQAAKEDGAEANGL